MRPAHVAVAMDGNGRRAKSRGLPRSEGRRAGADRLTELVEAAEHATADNTDLTLYLCVKASVTRRSPA
jgi:undecaprenyl diphosphate synthase